MASDTSGEIGSEDHRDQSNDQDGCRRSNSSVLDDDHEESGIRRAARQSYGVATATAGAELARRANTSQGIGELDADHRTRIKPEGDVRTDVGGVRDDGHRPPPEGMGHYRTTTIGLVLRTPSDQTTATKTPGSTAATRDSCPAGISAQVVGRHPR